MTALGYQRASDFTSLDFRLGVQSGHVLTKSSISAIDPKRTSIPGMESYPAQHDSIATSLSNVWATGLTPSDRVREWVAPMCSPRLQEGDHPLQTPVDLRDHILLHDDSISFERSAPNWESWLKYAGVEGVDHRRGPRFNHPDHSLQAAIDCAGVVLGRRCLAASDLAGGRLIEPLELALPIGLGFHFVCPPSNSKHSNVDIFRDWLPDEIGQST